MIKIIITGLVFQLMIFSSSAMSQNDSWIKLNFPSEYSINNIYCSESNNIYVGSNKGIFVSYDTGFTWNNISGRLSETSIVVRDIDSCDRIIIKSNDSLYLSYDYGINWKAIKLYVQDKGGPVWIGPGNLIRFDQAGFKYISIDSGQSWIQPFSPLTSGINKILRYNNNLYGCSGRISTPAPKDPNYWYSGSAFRCIDTTGEKWEFLETANYMYLNIGVTPQGKRYKYISGYQISGIYYNDSKITGFDKYDQMTYVGNCAFMRIDSTIYWGVNGENSWLPLINGLPLSGATQLISNKKGILFASAKDGLYRNNGFIPYLSNANEEISYIPTQYLLYQNYPNPFNPNTTIRFDIPISAFTTVKVFDIVGREVSVIISQELKAGSYSQAWNAHTLSSGVYYYTLQSGKYTVTKKLLLLK